MSPRILVAFAALGSITTLSACKPASEPAQMSAAGLVVEQVSIRTLDGKSVNLSLELARSTEEQAKGLKFRNALRPLHGMLFPMDPPRTAQFWMQDTIIPLDIIFVRTDGTISSINADTVPLSRAPVSATEPVAAVLELAGGQAAQHGITEGARLNWREFNK
jgi:uncharacterized protein